MQAQNKSGTEILRAIEALSGAERPLAENVQQPGPGGQAYDHSPNPPLAPATADPALDSGLPWRKLALLAAAFVSATAIGTWLARSVRSPER